jgi:hypothetical protein
VVLALVLAPLAALAAFVAFSEFTFWNEFASRFNFIAVDYLLFTNEVIGNIRESYNLPLLLSGVGRSWRCCCGSLAVGVGAVLRWAGTRARRGRAPAARAPLAARAAARARGAGAGAGRLRRAAQGVLRQQPAQRARRQTATSTSGTPFATTRSTTTATTARCRARWPPRAGPAAARRRADRGGRAPFEREIRPGGPAAGR